MRVSQQLSGCKVLLLLEKKRQPKNIEADFPHVSEAAFAIAWKSQGECWKEVDDAERLPSTEDTADDAAKIFRFFAIRYIELSDSSYIVWRTDHRDDDPYDTLGFFRGTFQEMRDFYAPMTYLPPKSDQE